MCVHPTPSFAANCLDCERLLAISFDRLSFLRSFPRARIEALRRKHRARLKSAEASPPRSRERSADLDDADACGTSEAGALPAPLLMACEPALLLEEDSSDGDGDGDGDGEAALLGDGGGEYDVVSSFDDVEASYERSRSFWL